jgi:hypothetical protein
MSKVIILILTLTIVIQSKCEVFSAIDELDKLAVAEKVIIDELRILANEVNDSYLRE